MQTENKPAVGLERIVGKCREQFRQPENLDHYSEENFKEAERKYIQFCLMGKSNWSIFD